MTQNERKEVANTLLYLSEIYSKEFSKQAFTFMLDSIEHLPAEKILLALKKYVRDPSSKFFPMPGQIIAMVEDKPNDRDVAVNVVNRIIEAQSKHGWNNPEKAREHVGEIGWLVVKANGGWQQMCESTSNDDLTIHRAQWRDSAMSIMAQARQGTLNQAPALPQPEQMSEEIKGLLTAFKPIDSGQK